MPRGARDTGLIYERSRRPAAAALRDPAPRPFGAESLAKLPARLNLNRTHRAAAGPLDGVTVVEIGRAQVGDPGAARLKARARVIAVERDEAGAGGARRNRRALSPAV